MNAILETRLTKAIEGPEAIEINSVLKMHSDLTNGIRKINVVDAAGALLNNDGKYYSFNE